MQHQCNTNATSASGRQLLDLTIKKDSRGATSRLHAPQRHYYTHRHDSACMPLLDLGAAALQHLLLFFVGQGTKHARRRDRADGGTTRQVSNSARASCAAPSAVYSWCCLLTHIVHTQRPGWLAGSSCLASDSQPLFRSTRHPTTNAHLQVQFVQAHEAQREP